MYADSWAIRWWGRSPGRRRRRAQTARPPPGRSLGAYHLLAGRPEGLEFGRYVGGRLEWFRAQADEHLVLPDVQQQRDAFASHLPGLLTGAATRTAQPARRGAVYRLALNVTTSGPAQHAACIPPGRAALRTTVRQRGLTGSVLDDLVTIATGLLTNAVQPPRQAPPRQAAPGPAGDGVRIEVTDSGRFLPRPGAGPGDSDVERGRGVLTVIVFAAGGTCVPRPSQDDLGGAHAPHPGRRPRFTRQARCGAALADLILLCLLRDRRLVVSLRCRPARLVVNFSAGQARWREYWVDYRP